MSSRAVIDFFQTRRAPPNKCVAVFARLVRCTGVCDSEIRRTSVRPSLAFGLWHGYFSFLACYRERHCFHAIVEDLVRPA